MCLWQNVDCENENERETPLVLAVGQGHKEIVEILIKASADLSFKGKGENTVLHHAATVPDSTEIIQMLISRREALVSEHNPSGDFPLHVA